MKAGLYFSERNVGVSEIDKPELREGEALIRVSYAGICGTDMMIYSGKHPRAQAPLTMGHEFSGYVEELGGKSSFSIGDSVVIEPTLSCGDCEACTAGQNHVCKSLRLIGIDRNGGFAEYVAVPLDRLHVVPPELDSAVAALAEPLSVAVHTIRRSRLKVRDDVVVLGAGPIGLLIALMAKQAGASQIFISDISPSRLSKAEFFGLHALNAKDVDVTQEVLHFTKGIGADVVFEVAGAQSTTDQMVDLVSIQGEVVVVSLYKQAPAVDLAKMHFKENTLTTTRCYSSRDFKVAVDMMRSSRLDISPIISHQLSIHEIEKGFSLMENPNETLKVLFKF